MVLLMEILTNVNSILVWSKLKTLGELTIVQLTLFKSNVLKSMNVIFVQKVYGVLISNSKLNKNGLKLILMVTGKLILVIMNKTKPSTNS
jgi:hypothetical protein